MKTAGEVLLRLEDVKTHFPMPRGGLLRREKGRVHAVDGVTLDIRRGEVLGLVGESGCGKTTLGRTIMRLSHATSGRVSFDGQDLAQLGAAGLARLRPRFQMVFQDPYSSLNPRMTVFEALAEPMLVHGLATRASVEAEVAALMDTVGLAPRFARKYPHEFSGGQRQRIAIARALALKPELLVADEPVSALDVSVQAQIVNLLSEIRARLGVAILFISHDLSVVRHLADRVAVMYLGKIVELGEASRVFENPLHPYTRALLSAVPCADPDREKARRPILLEGDPPSPLDPPKGCRFNPRCAFAEASCRAVEPALEAREPGHAVACPVVMKLS